MESIDLKQAGLAMLEAMKGPIGRHFEEVRELAEDELEDFAKRSIELAKKVRDGRINEVQARAILKVRQNAVETVVLSVAGIGLVAAQEAINAALDVLKGVIGKAVPGVNIL